MPEVESRKRNRMVRFRIGEISAVDRPAQVGARFAIAKRHGTPAQEHDSTMRHVIEYDTHTEVFDDAVVERDHAPAAPVDFESAVAAIKARDRCTAVDAMKRARAEHGQLFKSWQDAGSVSSRPVHKSSGTPEAVAEFNMIVDQIKRERSCSATQAMSIARQQHPAKYQAYQRA